MYQRHTRSPQTDRRPCCQHDYYVAILLLEGHNYFSYIEFAEFLTMYYALYTWSI